MKIIIDYNRTIFDPETDALYPGVFEALEALSAENELFLVSRNEPSRAGRLKDLEIENFFGKTMFVDHKSEEIFTSLIGKEKNVLVVGDSIRDEIRIGNSLGLITVRMMCGAFAGNKPASPGEIPRYEIRNLAELFAIIKKNEK